jgi:Glycosyl hydrolase family 79 C-terminal beta domain
MPRAKIETKSQIQKRAMSGGKRGLVALAGLVGSGCVWAGVALAQSPVTLTITNSPGQAIPTNFSGLSFGTISLKPGSHGYFFDSSDTQVVTLFQQLGAKCLRIGGTSVDTNNSGYTPANPDVDALFRFANATGVKVIYSVRLENGDPSQDAAMAGYIWNNYKPYLDAFSIGNEPDIYGNADPAITNYSSYLAKWRSFAATITNTASAAKFGGPDGGSSSKGNSWGTQFASAEASSGIVAAIHFHYYAGGSSASKTIQQIIDAVLSTNWVTANYPAEYAASGGPVLSLGLPYRFTEANSFYTGGTAGVPGGNNCFATALFALDYMHWWAANKCLGVNFHTSMWKYNGTFYPDANGNYQVYPVGYGIKAFDLGEHGNVEPLAGMVNTNGLNLTAYAVADATNLYVTIINKEHGAGGRNATVTIRLSGFLPGNVAAMYLTAPGGNAAATNGITLGGAAITNNGPWQGQWTALGAVTNGQCAVTVAACSAAIVKLAVGPGALAPAISLERSGHDFVITYAGTLLSATNVAGPYVPVADAPWPSYAIPVTNSQMFYRVRYPDP